MDHQAFAQLLGNYGEFVGAVAVVGTLVYLAAQIRQNTRAMEEGQRMALAENYIARVNQIERSSRDLALSQDLSEIMARGREHGINSLSHEDRNRYRSWLMAQFHRIDCQFYQLQRGLLDDEGRWSFEMVVRFATPHWRDAGILQAARPSFLDEINRIVPDGADDQAGRHVP